MARGRKKTAAELEAENKILKRTNNSGSVTIIALAAIKYGALAFIAYCGYLSVGALAGHVTMAKIIVDVLGNLDVGHGVAALFGIGGTAYGINERRLRKQTVAKQHGRTKELETQIDARRSSSNLTKSGDTNPKDRI